MQERTSTLHSRNTTWFHKFAESFLVVIGICNSVMFVANFFPQELIGPIWWKVYKALMIIVLTLGFLGIFFSVYWHVKEKKSSIDSDLLHSWCRGIIRYWLAFTISTYGFAKIFKTQFESSNYRDDMVIGQLSGFQLTWSYFGHSYTLAVIIGVCQIFGAILLLFRKTELLGTLILLPIMINIFLINIFFDIPRAAFVNSVIYSLALLYLLLLRWDDLKAVFWQTGSKIRPLKLGFIKPVARILAIGLAFTGIYLVHIPDRPSVLEGKWKVDQFIRNGDTIADNTWIDDQTVWKKVYVEKFGKLILSPNPYAYDKERAQWADFKYDSVKHELRLSVERGWTERDSMIITISEYNNNQMQWNTVFKQDTLSLKLSRVK